MAETPMRLVKRCAEYRPISEVNDIPSGIRGIYVLLKKRRGPDRRFDVVYIGMGRNSVKRRLRGHRRTKAELWDHFSVYEVWDNVRDQEIEELEGLLRHLFRRDTRANKLNLARSYAKLTSISQNDLDTWWGDIS